VLLVGVLVFVYYIFQPGPLLFNPAQEGRVRTEAGAEYRVLERRYDEAQSRREAAARSVAAAHRSDGPAAAEFRARDEEARAVRGAALALAERVTGEPSEDVNYVIPRFVLHALPIGLAGLFIAAIMAAAMSSIAAELNSLSTATVIDFYRRWIRPDGSDAHFLAVSKVATGLWGLFACGVAVYAATLGSLIEVVNRFGSFFYGSILGVFLLAMFPGARAAGAFIGLIAGMGAVAAVTFGAPSVSFLWHNVVGALTVLAVGLLVSGAGRAAAAARGVR